jgi:hypothetical protein
MTNLVPHQESLEEKIARVKQNLMDQILNTIRTNKRTFEILTNECGFPKGRGDQISLHMDDRSIVTKEMIKEALESLIGTELIQDQLELSNQGMEVIRNLDDSKYELLRIYLTRKLGLDILEEMQYDSSLKQIVPRLSRITSFSIIERSISDGIIAFEVNSTLVETEA